MPQQFRLLSRIAALALASAAMCAAQSDGEAAGFTFYTRLDGTHNQLGWFNRLDPAIGYNFNKYFAIDAGLPFYFVRPADAAIASGFSKANGIGNLHASATLSFPNPSVNYRTSLTITAPTGSEAKGLSTGRVTWDWNNHFDRTFGRVMPYGDFGFANAISDTPFFVRPFASHGFVAHFEGGALVRLANRFYLGGSGYAIEPSGEQTVVSRIKKTITVPETPAPQQGRGQQRRNQGVFEVDHTTVGPAGIARDRGASAWIMLIPSQTIDIEIGYSRSTTYRLDTVFLGIGFNLGSLFRRHVK